MKQNTINEIIDDQTKRALWEIKNVIDCVPDSLWNKEYCDMPLWKHIYHTLHSLDLWLDYPDNCEYAKFTLILAQFRHLHTHMGLIMGFIIDDTGLWPNVLGLTCPIPQNDDYNKYCWFCLYFWKRTLNQTNLKLTTSLNYTKY